MLKVILGSALGGLVAGGIALFAANQAREVTPVPLGYGAAVPAAMTQPMAPAVACAPHQEPVMQRVVVNGGEAATLTCVDRVPQGYVSYPPAGYAPYQQVGYVPPQVVTMAQPAPMEVVPPVRRTSTTTARARPARQVVYRDDDVVQYEPDGQPRRSVAKTAMIIGGSAGTGAGVGAIFGGKKGALIGAAIGGGAASIYEATKR